MSQRQAGAGRSQAATFLRGPPSLAGGHRHGLEPHLDILAGLLDQVREVCDKSIGAVNVPSAGRDTSTLARAAAQTGQGTS